MTILPPAPPLPPPPIPPVLDPLLDPLDPLLDPLTGSPAWPDPLCSSFLLLRRRRVAVRRLSQSTAS